MNAGGHSEQKLGAAIAHHRAGRLADAERLYRLACDADPTNARALHLWGIVAHQLNRSDAASLVGRAVMLDPDFAEAHNDRGVIFAANGLFADALPCFERAVALNPGYTEARTNLGRGLRSLGRLDEAVRQFALVLQNTPDSPVAHFNLASVFELVGQNPDAERHYRRAISLRSDFADAYIHLAALLQGMDRLPEALAHAGRAVSLRPDSAGARNNLGNILRTIGRHKEAIVQYEAALRIDPNSFVAHYNCGVALRGEARIAEAREHFARAFTLKPDFLEAELALCMAELPVLYEDESQIVERRDAYASRLARLSADIEGAGAPPSLAEAIGSHQPFYLPYQGRTIESFKPCMDRWCVKLWPQDIRRLFCQSLEVRTSRSSWVSSVAFSDSIRIGRFRIRDGSRISTRNRFRVFGYYTSGEQDAETTAAATYCERFVQGPISLGCLAANDPERRAACSDLSRNRDGQGDGSIGGPAARISPMLFLGTPCHEWISDDRLLRQQ